jgi:argininosuccinate lyase
MGEVVEQICATLIQIQSSLDLLHGVVANIDMAQQHMRAQMNHQAVAIADGSAKYIWCFLRMAGPSPAPGRTGSP